MRHLAVICMLLALPSATIAADMTHEETVVRTTYWESIPLQGRG